MKTWLIIFTLTFFTLAGTAQAEDIVFVVNADNPVNTLSLSDIRDFYFKRRRHWPDGESVRFIDRGVNVPIRQVFLDEVLRKSGSDVDLFWIGQKLYTGDSAPLRESSAVTTLQFISSFKGAIGYVSTSTLLDPKKVKAIKIED